VLSDPAQHGAVDQPPIAGVLIMSTSTKKKLTPAKRRGIAVVAVLIVLIAMGFGTKVVKIGSAADGQPGAFSPVQFGESEFPKIQAAVGKRAVDAATLAAAIAKDQAAAVKTYGVAASIGPEMSVKFTGTVGEGQSGVYHVAIDGVPATVTVRVQTGPAINGTDLRDATGTITFGQFVNQIEYQNAGSALNNEMKKVVLSKVDTSKLTGKKITVVGVFELINPNNWLVTPVTLSVQ
jgi:predicted lipoprotein